jgi:hypothetical protein
LLADNLPKPGNEEDCRPQPWDHPSDNEVKATIQLPKE